MGVLQDGLVYILVKGELKYVVPLAELELFQLHGVPASFITSGGATTWFIIIQKDIMQ